MSLSTRELLYLEDVAKMMESIDKNCSKGIQSTTDPQVRDVLNALSLDHKQWISTITNLVSTNGTLQ